MIVELTHPVQIVWRPKRSRFDRTDYIETSSPFEIRDASRTELNSLGFMPERKIEYLEMNGGIWAREGDHCVSEILTAMTRGADPHRDDQNFDRAGTTVLLQSPFFVSKAALKGDKGTFSLSRSAYSKGHPRETLAGAKEIIENHSADNRATLQRWLDENLRVIDGMVFTRRPPPVLTAYYNKDDEIRLTASIGPNGYAYLGNPTPKRGYVACFAVPDEENQVIGGFAAAGLTPLSQKLQSRHMEDFRPLLTAEQRLHPLHMFAKTILDLASVTIAEASPSDLAAAAQAWDDLNIKDKPFNVELARRTVSNLEALVRYVGLDRYHKISSHEVDAAPAYLLEVYRKRHSDLTIAQDTSGYTADCEHGFARFKMTYSDKNNLGRSIGVFLKSVPTDMILGNEVLLGWTADLKTTIYGNNLEMPENRLKAFQIMAVILQIVNSNSRIIDPAIIHDCWYKEKKIKADMNEVALQTSDEDMEQALRF